MKFQFINHEHNTRLLLIFAGWGMDAGVFTELRRPGYDIAVVWDYRTEAFDTQPLSEYGEIALIAWSMGVFEADRLLPQLALPLSVTIAVNGTRLPVDDTNGIPEAIFDGTLRGLNERSLLKFYRRMCGSSEAFTMFKEHLPDRTIEELSDELRIIKERSQAKRSEVLMRWDKAVVADNDAIIPTTNQINAWHGHEIHLIPGAHNPDWQKLIDTMLIDKDLVHDRFSKGFATYELEADAQTQAATKLWQLWQENSEAKSPNRLIEIGYGTGIFTRCYATTVMPNDWQLWDLVVPTGAIPPTAQHIVCDAEAHIHAIESESVDLIVSASTIQWFNSLPAFLRQATRVLRHGGKLIVSTFGPLTFRELSAAGVTPLPYPDTTSIKHYLTDAGLTINHISEEFIAKRFQTSHDALRHIRATGVNAVSTAATPKQVRRILANYPCAADGTAILTYQPIYIIATKS